MSIFKPRQVYKPFEYEWAEEYTQKQQMAHWLKSEVPMSGDINDWKTFLTPAEKNIIGNILKGFTQTEVIVADYWTNRVTEWFPKPEIVAAAITMGSFEVIHQQAYSHLNDSLGLDDYSQFLNDEATKAKLDALIAKSKSREDIAKSLAVFSAFAEGVQLFSSFAVLMSFSLRNLMKGVGQIVSWSVRDESLHSNFGCKLFRQVIRENPSLWTDDFKKTIYDAARLTVELEENFIDKVFEMGDIPNLTKEDLKVFIKHRANVKLGDLGLKTNWKSIYDDAGKAALERMDWFDSLTAGVNHQDFFAGRVTDYSRGHVDFSTIFDD
jgi:ribonucleoside-diphosphate reductase beta chain